ncbi:ATP-binding protein [Desulfohalobiaceae bacterium Ax17]|uniref:ATP-binding protein n=1 Tax=Desulfovulcanus ferrireducens TaxID=2831190 RepID=UPI0025A3C2BE|nr:ATP-binding protein [Desulfovulcanus ferrireducens]MBT8762379.1 ATP-binding protein [Desulfovulcanus ferrireducens]
MRVAVASGKGGTGKTTVAVNLARYLIGEGKEVSFIDCDVEEPNAHFFLIQEFDEEFKEYVTVPEIDTQKCLGESCKKCVQECRFKSLIWMVSEVLVFPELCHSCELCKLVCPAQAVLDGQREIGTVRHARKDKLKFYSGLLRIGEAMAPPLIRKVKEYANPGDVQILDCPPGTSCPVIESLERADFVVLVTEPTPFGLNDLKLAVELTRKLNYPFGVVINRDGMGDDAVLRYLDAENIPVLARFPHVQEAAQAYSQGKLLVDAFPEFKGLYQGLWMEINKLTDGLGGAR